MERKRLIKIHLGLPNFASMRRLIEETCLLPGTQIVSSSMATLACVRDFLESDARFAELYEWGQVEVLPLSDMIRNFANIADIQTLPIANPEHRKKIASIATRNLLPESRFFVAKDLPGFHEAFASFAREMTRFRVTHQSLEKLGAQGSELASLLARFEEALSRYRLGSVTHRIESLLECKPIKAKATKRIVWVGETEWPKMQIDLAKWLLEAGVEVHLLAEKHPIIEDFFPATNQLLDGLKECNISTLESGEVSTSGMFGIDMADVSAEIVVAADEFAECDWAIRQAILETDRKPNNFVVVYCRDLSTYGARLKTAALRLDSTIQMQRFEQLLTNPFALHALAALESCLANDVHPLADLCYSAYTGILPEHQEIASVAVRECMLSVYPFDAVIRESHNADSLVPRWVGHLLEWRDKNCEKGMTIADWERQFRQLTSLMPWLDESGGDLRTQFRDQSAQDSMLRSLTHSQISIDVSQLFTLEEFVRHTRQTWRDAEYLAVSKGKIRVVTSAAEIGNADLIFAIGMRDGIFPKRRAEDPFLADSFRLALPEFRLPSSYDRVEDERREFYRLIVGASRVVVSRPLTVDERGTVESSFLVDLRRFASKCETRSVRVENLWPDDESEFLDIDRIVRDAWVQSENPSENTNSFREAVENARSIVLMDESVIEQVSKLPRPLSLYLLRSLKRCPFQYAAHAKLGLAYRRKSTNAGWLQRVVRNADIVSSNGKEAILTALMQSLDKEMFTLRAEAPTDEVSLIRLSAPKLLESFAERESEARQLWSLEPIGKATTLKEIGYRTSVKIGETMVELDDRVDFIYRTEGLTVPMRLGYIPTGDVESKFDIGLILAFQPKDDMVRVAIVDSVENEHRQLVFRRFNDKVNIDFKNKGSSLFVDRKQSETAKEYIDPIVAEFKELVFLAMSGEMTPTPGWHCEQCELGGLCRRGQNLRRQEKMSEESFES